MRTAAGDLQLFMEYVDLYSFRDIPRWWNSVIWVYFYCLRKLHTDLWWYTSVYSPQQCVRISFLTFLCGFIQYLLASLNKISTIWKCCRCNTRDPCTAFSQIHKLFTFCSICLSSWHLNHIRVKDIVFLIPKFISVCFLREEKLSYII